MRCFIAIDAPEDVRTSVARLQEVLRRSDADVVWVGQSNLHLTLSFLGDLTEERVGKLRPLLEAEAARGSAMNLAYAGLGTFPEQGPPSVVWAGVTGDLEKLRGLAAVVGRAAAQIGVPREKRPFVAHLTLGRVKSGRNAPRLRAALEEQRQVSLGSADVREFALYRSTLTPQGSVYEVLERFRLGG